MTDILNENEDTSKRYFSPAGAGDKAVWMKNKIQKYTQAGIPDHQFSGGDRPQATRKGDVAPGEDNKNDLTIGMVELPHYLGVVKDAIKAGKPKAVKESTLHEGFPPKKVKPGGPEDNGDHEAPSKKKKKPPVGGAPNDNTAEDDEEADDNSDADGAKQAQDAEASAEDDAGEDGAGPGPGEGVDTGLGGSEVKTQLETLALQAAELFAEVDDKQAFDAEIKDALETAVEALGKVHAAIMNVDDSGKDDDKSGNNKPDFDEDGGVNAQQAESVEWISELSKKTLASYVKKASAARADAENDVGNSIGRGGYDRKAVNTSVKRTAGINKAVDKLAKD